MPARANGTILVFFAGSVHLEIFRGVTFLENDCHFGMIRIDTSFNEISGEIKLTRGSV